MDYSLHIPYCIGKGFSKPVISNCEYDFVNIDEQFEIIDLPERPPTVHPRAVASIV